MCQGYKPPGKPHPFVFVGGTLVPRPEVKETTCTQKATSHRAEEEQLCSTRTLSCSESSELLHEQSKILIKSCLKIKTQTESLQTGFLLTDSKKNVDFTTLEIRSYPLLLGDHPSTSCGPALTIDWNPVGDPLVADLETYEQSRGCHRTSGQCKLPPALREDWLQQEGYSRQEMKDARVERIRIQCQRLASSKDTLLDERKDKVVRKFKKWIHLAPSNMRLYNAWKEQASGAVACST